MASLTESRRLEIAAYIVVLCLSVPCIGGAFLLKENGVWKDLLVALSATFFGAGFLFFLLSRFFGLDSGNNRNNGIEVIVDFDFEDFTERIKSAKSICAVGITLASGTNRYIGQLRTAVESGVDVNILLMDPDAPSFSVISDRTGKHENEAELLREWTQSIDNLKKVSPSKGRFEVRLTKVAITWGLWIFDQDTDQVMVYAEAYSCLIEEDFCLKIDRRADRKMRDLLLGQYKLLWDDARVLLPSPLKKAKKNSVAGHS